MAKPKTPAATPPAAALLPPATRKDMLTLLVQTTAFIDQRARFDATPAEFEALRGNFTTLAKALNKLPDTFTL